MDGRYTKVNRKTNETDIQLEFNLDGQGKCQIETGIGFFNHMLDSFARHGFFDMKLTVKGDLMCQCPSYSRRYGNSSGTSH